MLVAFMRAAEAVDHRYYWYRTGLVVLSGFLRHNIGVKIGIELGYPTDRQTDHPGVLAAQLCLLCFPRPRHSPALLTLVLSLSQQWTSIVVAWGMRCNPIPKDGMEHYQTSFLFGRYSPSVDR